MWHCFGGRYDRIFPERVNRRGSQRNTNVPGAPFSKALHEKADPVGD